MRASNAFAVLALHEERDASAVAKLQSKRAQKKLQRAASREPPAVEECTSQGSQRACSSEAPAEHVMFAPPNPEPISEDSFEFESDAYLAYLYALQHEDLPDFWLEQQTQPTTSPSDLPRWSEVAAPPAALPPTSLTEDSRKPSLANALKPSQPKHPPIDALPHSEPQEPFPPLPPPEGATLPSTPAHQRSPLSLPPNAFRKKTRTSRAVKVLNVQQEPFNKDWEVQEMMKLSSLDLEWDLRLEGMVQKADGSWGNEELDVPLAEKMYRDEVFKYSSSRGCHQDAVWEMMRKAAAKQRAGAASDDATSSSGGSFSSDSDKTYWSKTAGKEWRQMIDSMMRNGWEPLPPGRSKHIKFRRGLVNGKVQMVMLPCTPSDSIRGITNFQAMVARYDREANEAMIQLSAGDLEGTLQ